MTFGGSPAGDKNVLTEFVGPRGNLGIYVMFSGRKVDINGIDGKPWIEGYICIRGGYMLSPAGVKNSLEYFERSLLDRGVFLVYFGCNRVAFWSGWRQV